MSFYATIQGNITYPTKERLQEVIASLTEQGWMKDGRFVDECGEVVGGLVAEDHDGDRSLSIPLGHYRNLARRLDDMTKDTKSRVVWSSTDGCFDGGVITDGVEKTYDLTEWAKENMEDEEDQTPPDMEEDWENYVEWTNAVEQEFHCEFI